MTNNHVTKLQIDLNAVKFNLSYFKQKLQESTKILVVVKAFGYGSDAVEITKSIQDKVDYFAVAYTDEGVALRKSGVNKPILVLHPQIANLELIIKNFLEPNIYSSSILDAFLSITDAQNLTDYPIHIKFNTGLNRLGFKADEILIITKKLNKNKSVKVASIFSHLAASEDKNERDFTLQQITSFKKTTADFEQEIGYKPMMHLCNTSGIINYPQAHFDMVRLGIGLYGFGNDANITSELKNVVSLKSIISQIHIIKKGQSVGYNRAFITDKNIKIATLPLGYADGIGRIFGKGVGFVTIKNQIANILGNVSMDIIMIDVTNIDCNEGDEVTFFDNQKTVEKLAKNSNTISYEIITSISQRIKREVLH
ncbi:MAG: alanine racemase [Flavobacteriaceae bacterium]|nr:alanine racemase [Flavobacteriaceae bacterium]